MRIMVLGGTGFIGRHAAAALTSRGHTVVIGTRHPHRARRRLSMAAGHLRCRLSMEGGRPRPPRAATADYELRETHLERLTSPESWTPLLAGLEVVVNSVGILRERGRETYDKVHHRASGALAAACSERGLRLVHVSALGLHAEARSRFLLSKLAGEQAIAATAADYSIVRPSLLDGERGYGSAWIRFVARWPIHFYPADAQGRTAALDVRDLGEAIAVLCEARGRATWREVELGGNIARTMPQYLAAIRALHDERTAVSVAVPAWMARIASHLFDLLHFSPYSYGHLELLRRDNLPRVNLLPALLGRTPTPVGRDRPVPVTAKPATAGFLSPS